MANDMPYYKDDISQNNILLDWSAKQGRILTADLIPILLPRLPRVNDADLIRILSFDSSSDHAPSSCNIEDRLNSFGTGGIKAPNAPLNLLPIEEL